jgi:two-component system sensor histidine kinase CpxA
MKSRRLFWKMFVSFWIAQTAFFVYLGYRTHQLTRGSGPLWLTAAQKALPLVAEAAVARYEGGGSSALAPVLQSTLDQRVKMWLIDETGHEVTGGNPPASISEAAGKSRVLSDPTVHSQGDTTLVAVRTAGKQGQYTLVAQYQAVPLLRGEGLFRLFAVSTILASIACLLLAHYLSAPIWRLRLASQRLANGDLDARAGENMGKRSDEIADLVRDFDAMAERIRDLLSNQKRLLGDVSHELRSPLARLRVALALARRHENEAQRPAHERIETEIERLDAMIGRILLLSRLEAGETSLSTAELDLNEVVESVLEDARYEAERTGHSIAFFAEANFRAEANEDLLRSSIENVLRNALYYTSGDEPIEVTLLASPGGAMLRVRDHGPGVPPETLPKLFRAFYRADDSRVTGTGGTGLGLAIAKRALVAHGGTISARNATPHGLVVEMTLPARTVPVMTAQV